MEIKYNGTKISAITFNGSNVEKVIYNGTTVFCESCTASMSSCGTLCKTDNSGNSKPPSCGCSGPGFGAVQM